MLKMQQCNTERNALKTVFEKIPRDTLTQIAQFVDPTSLEGQVIQEILNPMDSPASESSTMVQTLRQKWVNSKPRNRFSYLMEGYVDSYLHGKCFNKYGDLSKSALEEMVNCHSKWDRMMRQHGQGRQYRDDIRRLCFLFQLELPQANELMWSAGQIFDFGDFRDYVLTDCLNRKIFDPDKVDEELKKEGLAPLFPDDNAKNRKIG